MTTQNSTISLYSQDLFAEAQARVEARRASKCFGCGETVNPDGLCPWCQ